MNKKHYRFLTSTKYKEKKVWCECKSESMKLVRKYCELNNMKIHGKIFIKK